MNLLNRTRDPNFHFAEDRLQQISSGILQAEATSAEEFSLIFVRPAEIKKLNNDFRQLNEVTDVLSFPSDGEIDPETGNPYLGDVIICAAQAATQAEQSGHPLQNEIELLLIHGLLHLLDYDHDTDERKELMWEKQRQYLTANQIELGRTPGDETHE